MFNMKEETLPKKLSKHFEKQSYNTSLIEKKKEI